MKLEFPLVIDCTKKVIAFEFKAINTIDRAVSKCIISEEEISQTSWEEPVQTPWYKNEAIKKNIALKMSQFTSFAKSNPDDESIAFIVTDTSEDTHVCDKGVQLVSYINGKHDDQDFEPPSSPTQLVASNVQHDSVNLTWSKPQYGSTLVQNYTVFYHTEDDPSQEFRSQVTEDNKTAVVVTGLVPETQYIFKVQANCPTGKSEASENITVKTQVLVGGDDQHMEDYPTPCQQIPTLGRPFRLGMLYNYYNDCLLPNLNVWRDNALKTVVTKTSENVVSRFDIITDIPPVDALGVEANLKLSFFAGLIKESNVSGSAKYLYNYKSSKQQARVAIRYKYISHTERVNHEVIPNDQYSLLSNEHVGTHVVTGISYGAETIFVIDQEVADYKKYQQICEELQEKAAQFCNALNKQCDDDLLQLPMIEEYTVTYFGDVPPQKKTSTFQDVANVCKNLPEILRGENTSNLVPQQVYLHPLSELNSGMFPHLDLCVIRTGLVSQVENIMQCFQDVEIKCKRLTKTNVYQYFSGIQEQLSKFITIVFKYKQNFVEQLAVLLPKIRGGQEKERELEKLCEKHLASQFSCKILSSWIEEKECEVTFITECLLKFQHVSGKTVNFF